MSFITQQIRGHMTEPKPKQVYNKRRDYKAELEELVMYAKLSLELLGEMNIRIPTQDKFVDGQMATLMAVLERIEKKP